MAFVTPYCQVWGHNLTSIVRRDGMAGSGGELEVEEIETPYKKFAELRTKGYSPRKYTIKAFSKDRDVIEEFLEVVNTAPEDAEIYPFDAERHGLIGSSHATMKQPVNALGKWLFEAVAEVTCRESWLYGPDQGIDFRWIMPFADAVSGMITNTGHMKAPINYLQCGGDRIEEYVEDLSVRITPESSTVEHDRELVLCDKLLRGDIFEVGWRGEVRHTWEAQIISMAGLSRDVHNKTLGGSITDGILTLDDGDYVMIPFHGPLPVSGEPGCAKIELTVDALTGDGASIYYALKTDLADMTKTNHDALVVGENEIYIPDVGGAGHLAIGIKAAESGSVDISAMKGTVGRYVAASQIPALDVGETGKIRVEATAGQRLRFLQVAIPNRYWY